MTTNNADATTAIEPRFLNPEEIGSLVKLFRTNKGWTQETLAELSGLTPRTIQRVEHGQPSTHDTRRAIGRAFAFDDIDYFNTLKGTPSDAKMRKQNEAFEREHLLLDARTVDGRQLLTLMQDGPGFGAFFPMSVVELPGGAQDVFADIVDFVHDCTDVFNVASRRNILGYGDTLDETITKLKGAGFCLCAAFRDTKLANDPCRITYLLAAPKDQPAARVAVLRKLTWGF